MERSTIIPRRSGPSMSKGLRYRKNAWVALFALVGAIAAPPVMSTPGDAANFTAASVTVDEGAGTVTLTVLRQGIGGGTASVDYASGDLTATAPSDYGSVSGTLSWGDGDLTPRTITIPIVDDALPEADEIFSVGLSNPQGLALGVLPSEAVVIADNDAAAPVATPAPMLGGTGLTLLAGLLGLVAILVSKRRSLQR